MDVNFLSSAKTIYAKIVQVIVYAAAFLVPLWYLPFTSGILEYNKQVLLIVLAAVGLIVWLLGVVVSGKLTVRSTPIDKGIIAFLIATIVATIFSVLPVRSVFGFPNSLSSSLMSIAALTILYLLAVNTITDKGRILRRVVSFSAMLTLVIGLLQVFHVYILPGAVTHSRAFNTVGSINVLGLLAAVLLPFFAKSISRAAGIVESVVGIIGTVASLVLLVILNWWVLWAAALIGMLAIIAFDSLNATQLAHTYGPRGRFALSRFIIPVVVIVLGAVLLLVNFTLTSIRSEFPLEVAPSYRLSSQVAATALKDRPIFGYGPENYNLVFDTHGASRLGNTEVSSFRFFDANVEVLTIAVQGGAITLLALLLVYWCLIQAVTRFGSMISGAPARGEGALFAVQSSGVIAAAITLTAAMFLYAFPITLYSLWFVLLALTGLIVAGEPSHTIDIEEKPRYSLAASLGFILALILVLTALYLVSMRYWADTRYAKSLNASTNTHLLEGLSGAIALDPSNDQYLRDSSQATLQVLQEEINNQAKKSQPQNNARIQDLISSAVQLAQQATDTAPQEALNWENLGMVYRALSGVVSNLEQLAETAFLHAAAVRPGDPRFDNEIGTLWLNRANLIQQSGGQSADALSRAETAFKHAIATAPNFGLAIYNLGAVYERQGKISEAIAQLEKVVPYNTNDATVMFQLGLLYTRAGRKNDALTAFQRAVLISPQFADARWYLALLLEERGDLAGALAQLLEIQKTNSSNTVLQQKISQLQAGQRSIPPAKVIDSKPL